MPPIFTDGLRLEPEDRGVTDYAASFGASLSATAAEALADSPTSQLAGLAELDRAKGTNYSRFPAVDEGAPFGVSAAAPDLPAPATIDRFEAESRIKAAGLGKDIKLPDQETIAAPVVDIMISRARERKEREVTIARGPQGLLAGTAGVTTSFLVGAIDPLNLASAFIPVVGELRYGKMLASAGDSFLGRTAVRAGVGGASGMVGQAVLEPLNWHAHTQDGRDFGMTDVLHDLVFGAALGGGLHAAGGGIRDVYRKRKGLAQYPFGPGEPMERVDGVRIPESVLREDGVSDIDLPDHLQPVVSRIDQILADSPAMHILRDLPPRAQEDSMRAAIASIVDGEPVKVGEMLEAAAKADPRIAESFEAWHGSPHEFDRFDISKLGTGEGAQAYGHGLYFAENEKVARSYQRATSDKAFVNKVAELYDEGFSPDDAWAQIKDNWKDFSPAEQRLMTALEKDDWLGFDYPHQAVNAALRDIKAFDVSPETAAAAKAVGNMYRVKIAANREDFLDWDRPLAEQSEHVRSKLRAAGYEDHQTGKDVYHSLVKYRPGQGGGMTSAGMKLSDLDATPEAASGRLRATGIHGIQYLDQGSRDAGAGTRNYVVFDDKHIEIVDRNGVPVAKPFTEQEPGNPKITLGGNAPPDVVTKAKAPKARGRAAADPQTWSLFEYLASRGGLKPDADLLSTFGGKRGPFVPGFGPLLRKGGMSMDDALIAAKEGGYFLDPTSQEHVRMADADRSALERAPTYTVRDLMEKIDEESRGRRSYRDGHIAASKYDPEQEKHVIMGHLEQELEASGADVSAIDPKLLDRTVEIVHREGESDVLVAYERAIMEDSERYESIANARDAADQHPARDVPFDGRTAPGRGGDDFVDGGAAGRAGPGGSDADGAQSPRDGAADIGAIERSWRDLSTRTDDVSLLEASRAADQLPDPVPSRLDERVTAAEKADAFAKQMYDMFADRLPEAERQRLDDLIKSLDEDMAVRKDAIERSGACLFGARAT